MSDATRNMSTTLEEALTRELIVRPYLDRDAGSRQMFTEGFRTGWLARATEPGMVLVTREYLALLEERARLWVRAGGR